MKQDYTPESITLRDVAKATGVSRTTVSNAFNRPDQLSPELREKVLKVAKEMGYSGPNPMARQLRTGYTGAIGLVFSEAMAYAFSDPVAIAFLQGVAQVCERKKSSLLIVPASRNDAAQETIQQAAVDGFIIYCMPYPSGAVTKVLERQLPVVAVDQSELAGISSIGIDDRQAARQAAEHLIRLNHKRLAIIAFEFQADAYSGTANLQRIKQATYANALLRWQGYTDAMLAAGIDPNLVPVEERLGNSEAGAFDAALSLLQRDPRPTGILAMSDRLAIGAIRAAEHLGLSVPKDVSVVGFDDIPQASQIHPALTTIQQPLVEKGAIAAELLLDPPPQKVSKLLEAKLVIRESSGVAPS